MMVKMGIVKMMVMMKMVVRLFFLKINSTKCFCHNDLGPQGDNEKGVGFGGGSGSSLKVVLHWLFLILKPMQNLGY